MDRIGISISEVIGKYVQLRRSGKELTGLCPFHSEVNPSFFVNEERGVFYCFSCSAGGDLITFIEKAEGLGFKDALARLGVDGLPKRAREDQATRGEAKLIVAWAQTISDQIGEKLREIGQYQRLTREFTDKKLAEWQREVLKRQWDIITVIDDDLTDPNCLIELYQNRHMIEDLLA